MSRWKVKLGGRKTQNKREKKEEGKKRERGRGEKSGVVFLLLIFGYRNDQ